MPARKDFYSKDFYSKEASLKRRSKRELANGQEKECLEKLRLLCFSRGAVGILVLGRAFRDVDGDGSKGLNHDDFYYCIRGIGLDLNDEEINDLFDRFNIENAGTINIADFMQKLRPDMPQSRLEILDKAFAKMDPSAKGIIDIVDLEANYCVKEDPLFKNGEMTAAEILEVFIGKFDFRRGNLAGKVTKEDFINYYSTISASIDSDAYFRLLIRILYKL